MNLREYVERNPINNRRMLEELIPARLDRIYRTLAENPQGFEEWRLDVTVDLVESVKRNCEEMTDTGCRQQYPLAAM